MPQTETYLTWSAVKSYGGRKKPGRVSILVHSETEEIHIVPRDIEHINYVMQLLNTEDYDTIREKAQRIIPSHIEVIINPETGREEVTSIHTGDSGLEIRFGVRHTKEDIHKGHELAKNFAYQGEVPISQTLKETINEKYLLPEK